MRYRNAILCVFTFLLSTHLQLPAQGLSTDSTAALVIKIANGMNAVMKPITGAQTTELSIYIKVGSVYENDSVSGISKQIAEILGKRIETAIQKGALGLSPSNTSFSYAALPEQTVYRFECTPTNITPCLSLMQSFLFNASFLPAEIDSVKAHAEVAIAKKAKEKTAVFESRLMQEVFLRDYNKMNPDGDTANFQYINADRANTFYQHYYVPNNAIILITGNFDTNQFQEQFDKTFNGLWKSAFDPETIIKIIDFHPMIYNNQFIVTDDSITQPEFQICWQFPGTYSYQQGSYYAQLLTTMLNDKNNYLNVMASKMGCRKLSFQYEANNFSGVLRATLQPDKNKLMTTYEWLIKQLMQLDQTLINESMLDGGKLLFANYYSALKNTKDYPRMIVKNWPYNDNSYFLHLKDSVMDVNVAEMKRFVAEYMEENAHISGLMISNADRQSLSVDTAFTDVNDSVGNYVFYYNPNITDPEGAENQTMLRNLLQWLKANPDVNIKINGFADIKEYNKAYDDTIIRYIDSIPTFRKTMPDIIAKGYLKPGMMRAIKIIKYLDDHGIDKSRLSGTSMPMHSSNRTEEKANMKCTVVLNKMRKVISLYEFHYGKTKPN